MATAAASSGAAVLSFLFAASTMIIAAQRTTTVVLAVRPTALRPAEAACLKIQKYKISNKLGRYLVFVKIQKKNKHKQKKNDGFLG